MARGNVVTFSVKGGKQLEQTLKALGDQRAMRSAARTALRKAAAPMVEAAKAKAPLDQGNLKESIKQGAGKVKGKDRDLVRQVVGIDLNVQPPEEKQRSDGSGTYRDPGVAGVGPIIEFGTPDTPAEPFMRTAFEANKERARDGIPADLKTAIDRQAKRLAKKAAKA